MNIDIEELLNVFGFLFSGMGGGAFSYNIR